MQARQANSVLRRLRLNSQLLLDLEQLPISVLPPVKILAVLPINCTGEFDATFEVAQLDKGELPIIQVDAIFLGDAIGFVQTVLDIEKLGDRKRWADDVAVCAINLVGECDSRLGVIRGLRRALMHQHQESDGTRCYQCAFSYHNPSRCHADY